jgi:hypothetical protein
MREANRLEKARLILCLTASEKQNKKTNCKKLINAAAALQEYATRKAKQDVQ